MLERLAAQIEDRDNRIIAAIAGKDVIQSALTVLLDDNGRVLHRRKTETGAE